MENHKKQKPSEETLVRKGDIVYRVNKSDGSGRGNFRSGGGGHSPHSDRRHGNSTEMEDLFHKADNGDQMAKQELDKRGLWLDLRRSNVFAQPTDELLNQLELTRDFEPTRRMKERRKMLVAALMGRNEVLGEAFVKASSTEELHTMQSTYEAHGRPPHFTETARLINKDVNANFGTNFTVNDKFDADKNILMTAYYYKLLYKDAIRNGVPPKEAEISARRQRIQKTRRIGER